MHAGVCTHRPGRPTANAFDSAAGPSHTREIQRQFVTATRRRMRTVRGLVRRTVGYENDALGLTEGGPTTVFANAEPRERFDFPTQHGVTEAFIRWLQEALREEALEPATLREVREGQHWSAPFVRAAVLAGVNQSTGILLQRGVSTENPPDSELLDRPIFARTLRDLYQRTYGQLETVTEEAAPQVRETLTEGFARGWNPRRMTSEINGELEEIQRSRLETVARSETVNAHSTATLRNYRRAGVDVVSHGEWRDAGDSNVCAFCRALSGAELALDEMEDATVSWREESDHSAQTFRLLPPAHPNCRCTILPVIGADAPATPLAERVPGAVQAGA